MQSQVSQHRTKKANMHCIVCCVRCVSVSLFPMTVSLLVHVLTSWVVRMRGYGCLCGPLLRQQTYPSYHQTYLRVRFEKRSLSLMVRGVWPKTNDRLRSGSSNMFGFFGPRVRGVVLPPLGRKCTAQMIFIALPFWLKISSRRFRFPPALTIEKSDSGVMGPPTPRGSASLMNWHSNSKFASTSPRDIQCQTVASSCSQVIADIWFRRWQSDRLKVERP